jgi:hypothetical protein
VVPAASGFGSTEVHPATIPGRSMGERRWQHILALYYRRNGPHPALIDRHMLDEPQTVYVGLIGLGLLCVVVPFVAAISPISRPDAVSANHATEQALPLGRAQRLQSRPTCIAEVAVVAACWIFSNSSARLFR